MKRIAVGLICIAVVATGALVLVLAHTDWLDDYNDLTILLAGIAAISGVAGVLITYRGDRSSDRHLRALAEQQEQAASDIRRLAELTESSLEEARAQKPEPIVQFIVGEERDAAPGVIVTRRRFARTIDVGKIVAAERQAALATLPPEHPPDDEQEARQRPVIPALASLVAAFGPTGPITGEERRSFELRVTEYGRNLEAWLRAYESYRQDTDLFFGLLLRFENRGRVPARGVRVVLRFPDGFTHAEDDSIIDKPPRRPSFARRRVGLSALDRALLAPDYSKMLIDSPFIPGARNVSGPYYRDGSLIVEFDIETLLHGPPEDSDEAIMLTIESDGEFTIPWEMHAENLGEPAQGELKLQIVTELEAGDAITSLADLPALRERNES